MGTCQNLLAHLSEEHNYVLNDFRVRDSELIDSLHITYCMHLYGCEL